MKVCCNRVSIHVAALMIGILGLIFTLIDLPISISHLLNVSKPNNGKKRKLKLILWQKLKTTRWTSIKLCMDDSLNYFFPIYIFNFHFRRWQFQCINLNFWPRPVSSNPNHFQRNWRPCDSNSPRWSNSRSKHYKNHWTLPRLWVLLCNWSNRNLQLQWN